MDEGDPSGTEWTAAEVDLIVGDYFDMLQMELSGQSFVKTHRNAELQRLTGRSKGSIEYKHQNISAVLEQLELPWIWGYKPAANFQRSLIDGVERYLSRNQASLEAQISDPQPLAAESPGLYFEPPPEIVARTITDNEPLRRLIRKFDPAERDARNRTLGRQGEMRVLMAERSRLTAEGRGDLARKVEWTSQERGDGAGYDILSFDTRGGERLLEVKTTVGRRTAPFYLTENERLVSNERPDAFRLVRLYDFAREPRAFELAPPLDQAVMLRPTTYRASFSR